MVTIPKNLNSHKFLLRSISGEAFEHLALHCEVSNTTSTFLVSTGASQQWWLLRASQRWAAVQTVSPQMSHVESGQRFSPSGVCCFLCSYLLNFLRWLFLLKDFFWWYLLPWYPWGRWSKFNFTTGAYVWYCPIRFLKLSKSFNHRI